ncbi:hypothetical protein AVEN_28926-1 [Araneus ventricosus]|uniref:Uncharacterized protein n=1 Tax=Araneus ventricosus TaxID=182803 RepID=A0A4Y2AJE1_ARAVE|nr:hypothetical protein AVEN_28926-1 [Araneus ventricosus]
MPLKPEFPETMLGNSKMIASKRLDQLWTRLERDPIMKALYSEFLNEYESLHHMEEVKEDTYLDAGYYLPHHGILRPDNKAIKGSILVPPVGLGVGLGSVVNVRNPTQPGVAE